MANFGRTKAYELIAHDRIRAYKMGGKTMIDLDSVDEYHASAAKGRNESKLGPSLCAEAAMEAQTSKRFRYKRGI